MRRFFWLVLACVCLDLGLGLGLFVASAAAEDLKPAAERVAVSDFGLESLDGAEKRLAETKGKVVVLSFWATWCAPCLQELEHLNRFQQAYPDDLVVLAVSVDDAGTIANVRRVAKRNSWVMTVLLDQEGKVSAVLNPRGTNPFSIFLDREGRVALSHEGYAPGDEVRYEELLKALIAEPKP
jgi:thiol-disulfide isomerase/thioredoxin